MKITFSFTVPKDTAFPNFSVASPGTNPGSDAVMWQIQVPVLPGDPKPKIRFKTRTDKTGIDKDLVETPPGSGNWVHTHTFDNTLHKDEAPEHYQQAQSGTGGGTVIVVGPSM